MLKKHQEDSEMSDESNGYDSMIENGTSEEDDDSDVSEIAEKEIKLKNDKSEKPSKRKAESKPQKNDVQGTTSTKKPKFDKVIPPTLEEINELKETRNLFHSNLFRLQVKEMLTELKVKEKHLTYITNWLEKFKEFVHSLPAQSEKEDAAEMKWLNKSPIKLPLDLTQLCGEQRTFHFQFLKPTVDPYLIGDAAAETFFGTKLTADVCVTMPGESFQKDNYLNLIYDQKRALFLVYLANAMLKKKFNNIVAEDMHFNYHANNPLKPVLEITSSKQKVSIRIFVVGDEKSFKLNRFVPWNNNIRSKIFDIGNEDESTATATPTPHYNANVLYDLTMQRNQEMIVEVFKGNKNFQDALILLKIWLQQRHLNVGYVGFSFDIMAMFICYLQHQRKVHQKMSSYQVARTVWNQLAHSSWDKADQGITFSVADTATPSNGRPTLAQFHEHYDVVFVDVTGFYNICANVSTEIYRRVCLEAKFAVDMLNDMKLNSFQTLFMSKNPLYTQIDHILKISKQDAVEQILEMNVPLKLKQDYAGYAFPQLLNVVGRLIKKGLGQRIQTLLPIEQPAVSWPCSSQPNRHFGQYLQLGLVLHPTHAYEVLDKGPESIDKTAEDFRRFWGDKAKLRRFQDGSITESVVWASVDDTLAQKRLVSRSIVLHLLQQHLQLEPNDIIYIAGELDVVYKLTPAFKTEHMHEKFKVPQDTDAEALCLRVIRNFDDLVRKLQALKELPLEIVSIVGISPIFRYCEPTPILPQSRLIANEMYAGSVQRGVIQLALSSKWPAELVALQAMKTAFYIQIAQLLREKYKLIVNVTYDGIFVLKQGYCYRIEIAHPKELALLKQTKTERGITQYIDTPASIALEKQHYVLPKVTGALHALHHQHPSFGAAVMIAKRWLYAQLIDPGLWPDECTELLIALLYIRTIDLQQVTSSPQTGFIRFLQVIANTDWKAELFLLNFNNAMEENEISDLEHRFNSEREKFPPLCIATAYDRGHYGKLWSNEEQPSVNVIARVTLLARQSLELIETSLLTPTEGFVRPSKLFVPSNQGYDLIIQLKPDQVPNSTAFDFGSNFAALSKPNWRLPLAGTDYMKAAVAKLRTGYGEFAAFFYNPCGGGKIIGVVWKPTAFNEREFKVNEVHGTQVIDNQKIRCSKEVFIEDFKFILKDYYLRIDTVEAVFAASQTSSALNRNIKQQQKRYFDSTSKQSEGTHQNSTNKLTNKALLKKAKHPNNKSKPNSKTKRSIDNLKTKKKTQKLSI